ncbi:MAG: hypothetical protein QOJ09_842 [Actinomycetota bacterium]|nr:hypothetical protein [Actinomycetota bacterium]
MPSFRTGTVTSILSERHGMQRVEVDGEQAYVLNQLIGPVAVGDRVVMNTTAVELGLGTGGWHVVHWNLERDAWSARGAGHEMKLRYTSLQVDTGMAPAPEPGDWRAEIDPPLVACFLHSQVAVVANAFKHVAPQKALGYVMTDGGALPLAFSDVVAHMRDAGTVDVTVTAGQAFGGEREAVNVHHALQLCDDQHAVVVGMGPGSLGTGTEFGFSGMEVASILEAGEAMSYRPIVALRVSDADPRNRHLGISHHARTVLDVTTAQAVVPIPRGEPIPEVGGHEVVEVDVPDLADLDVTSMGRTPKDDPRFFAYAAAAGVYAAQLLLT